MKGFLAGLYSRRPRYRVPVVRRRRIRGGAVGLTGPTGEYRRARSRTLPRIHQWTSQLGRNSGNRRRRRRRPRRAAAAPAAPAAPAVAAPVVAAPDVDSDSDDNAAMFQAVPAAPQHHGYRARRQRPARLNHLANATMHFKPRHLPRTRRIRMFAHHSVNSYSTLVSSILDTQCMKDMMDQSRLAIDLGRASDVLDAIRAGPDPPYFYQEDEKKDIHMRSSDYDGFVKGTVKRMYFDEARARREAKIYPYINANEELEIPIRDVHDLPIYIFFYIIDQAVKNADSYDDQDPSRGISYTISYSLDNGPQIPVTFEGTPVRVENGFFVLSHLNVVYNAIMQELINLFPGLAEYDTQEGKWKGHTEPTESGVRIMLYNRHRGEYIPLKLTFTPIPSQQLAGRWSQKMEDLLEKNVGTSVVSVRNTTNDKCLVYCLVIGIITRVKECCDRVFGRGELMLDPDVVFMKGSFMFPGDDEVSSAIRRLSRCLMPPVYSQGESDDPLIGYVETIDKMAGTWMSIHDFRSKFEEIEAKLVPEKVCGIDVYGIDYNINSHVYPLYMTKRREGKIIELLCVTDKETRCSHFCLIVNFRRLMTATKGKQFYSCSKCGECFYHRHMLQTHNCPKANLGINTRQPPGDDGYHFSAKNDDANLDVIEGVCTKCRLCFASEFQAKYHKDHCFMEGKTGYRHVQLVTYKLDEHPTLNGVEIDMEQEDKHVLERRMMYADFESSINPETGEHTFMSYGIYDWMDDEYKCGYTLDEMFEFILEKAFSDDTAIHVYVYFHNAMNYDANFILRWVLSHEECRDWGIQVIMKSSNRLQKLQFHVMQDGKKRIIHIGDTFLFLTLSLERIVGSIRKDELTINKDNFDRFFHIFKKRYEGVSDVEINHILRKNIFPYRFFTDSSKLDCPIADFLKIFEPKEENLQYFSESVGVEELQNGYEDNRHVMDVFRCRTARDYHDLYLCCDVMQLADVFNRSMEILWDSHHIHLTRYLGMPSASWAAFLRFDPTMKIPLYEDTFFAEFFKGMVRGGVTSAALRHAVADDKHSIIYLDVNGLYPYVMQRYKFPCGLFKMEPMGWEGEMCEVRLRELFGKFERENRGMCFCVDMHIPVEVQLQTDMYPFAPEHRNVTKEYYLNNEQKVKTPFLRAWSEANEGADMDPFSGLVCTLYDKEKYNVHWRLLQFYMDHGVKVTKVYFAVSFDEGEYLAGYIRKNIAIRNERKDELGKTLYKLLGNSIYGKTFESPFKRCTYLIVRTGVQLQGLLDEGKIAAMYPVDEYGWIVKLDGDDIVLDKPTYIGACVCEFAKLHMYQLLYDKLMKIFPDVPGDVERGCQMVYTDTDSFIVKVRHPDGVGDGPGQTPLFDYIKREDPDLIGGIGGQVKSETGDDTIAECIALRSKVYAYKTKSGHIGKRAKGTTKEAQELQLDWEVYKKTLNELTAVKTRNVQFVRNVFKISTVDVYRQSLSVNDGKRYICADGIHTHAFGFPLEYDEAEQQAIEHEYDLVCEDEETAHQLFSSPAKKRRE